VQVHRIGYSCCGREISCLHIGLEKRHVHRDAHCHNDIVWFSLCMHLLNCLCLIHSLLCYCNCETHSIRLAFTAGKGIRVNSDIFIAMMSPDSSKSYIQWGRIIHLCTNALMAITCGSDYNGTHYIRIYAASVVHNSLHSKNNHLPLPAMSIYTSK